MNKGDKKDYESRPGKIARRTDEPEEITGKKRERFGPSMPSNVRVVDVSQSINDFPPEVQAALLNHRPQLEPGHVGEKQSIKSIRFAVCIENTGYPAALELYKIYPVIQDETLPDDCVRVVDESGEDYVYPSRYFAPVELPPSVGESILKHLYKTG